jgi:hypothetical protein
VAKDRRHSTALHLAIMGVMLVGLPLSGIALSGRDIHAYLAFPPLTLYVRHAPFSAWVFLVYTTLDLLLIMAIGRLFLTARGKVSVGRMRGGRWPVWGWAGAAILLGGWALAWTRMAWFAPFQAHTFCLPWIGYILLVNAACLQRSGRSLLTDAPDRFVLLICASALFWWFFEYLNRFVQNWYYEGVDDFSPLAYFTFASLAFASVLPAVLSTYRLLLSFPLFESLGSLRPIQIARPRMLAARVLTAAALGLALLGIFPDTLFGLLWVSPLLVITALQTLGGRTTIFAPLAHGDWRPIVTAALAALICGFCWELWNIGSLARWHYTIPYVDRYRIFAMPVLGYGGYLPFGLECLAVGAVVVGHRALCITAPARSLPLRPRHT